MNDSQHKLSLHVEGEVTATDLQKVVNGFVELVTALTLNQDPDSNLEWIVDDLKGGSAYLRLRPEVSTAAHLQLARNVETAYDHLAASAATGNIDEYGPDVIEPLEKISSVLNPRIPGIKFATSHGAHDVIARIYVKQDNEIAAADSLVFRNYVRTALRGKIVNLSDKQGLCFTLQEDRTKRQVRCYPPHRMRQQISKIWADKSWILVEGTFKRFSDKGTMSQISEIHVIEGGDTVNWRDAIGCAPRALGREHESVNEAVRKLRDG